MHLCAPILENRRRLGTIVVVLLGTACHEIESVSPDPAQPGASITIEGSQFLDDQGGFEVRYDGAPLTVQSWSTTTIVATLPGAKVDGSYSLEVVMASDIVSTTHEIRSAPPEATFDETISNSGDNVGASVVQTSDGGYLLGELRFVPSPGVPEILVRRLDGQGSTLWTVTDAGSGEIGFSGVRAMVTPDGGIAVVGGTASLERGASGFDGYLLKLDGDGVFQWSKTYGGSADDGFGWGEVTSDGGFIMVGETESFGAGGRDVYLVRADASGTELWSQSFGGELAEYSHSVAETADGGFIIAATTHSFGAGYADVWLIKTDALGDEVWSRTYGGASVDETASVRPTRDGGYVFIAQSQSFGSGPSQFDDWWIVKTDALGNQQWSTTAGLDGIEFGWSIRQAADGSFIAVVVVIPGVVAPGATELIKLSESGTVLWRREFGPRDLNQAFDVEITAQGGYVFTGNTRVSGALEGDTWIVKTDSDGNV